MNKTKKVIIIILMAVLAILLAVVGTIHCIRRAKRAATLYPVYCDDKYFIADSKEFLYAPGSTVKLLFPLPAKGVDYDFNVIGVKTFDAIFDEQQGYTVQFAMPYSYVSVYYQVAEPFDGIAISMKENPTTGYVWNYSIAPDAILTTVEDRYVSNKVDSKEPLEGVGGTHYWKFKIEGSGTVTVKLDLCRAGGEPLETISYSYQCNPDGSYSELL